MKTIIIAIAIIVAILPAVACTSMLLTVQAHVDGFGAGITFDGQHVTADVSVMPDAAASFIGDLAARLHLVPDATGHN